jgi:4'-phosphopantetheinyl transferase
VPQNSDSEDPKSLAADAGTLRCQPYNVDIINNIQSSSSVHPPSVLDARSIDVWAVQLSALDAVVERCIEILSLDERVRANRYRFEDHRRSYILSRGVLRTLLGFYLSVPPAEIQFSYGEKGKPDVSGVITDIRFNSSRSAGVALYALTRHCELGVDIEQIRSLQDIEQIADRFFCSEEARELFNLPASQRESAFFNCWSRKEAYIKAVGDGLSMPLNGFRVTLKPNDPAKFVHLGNDRRVAQEWTLQNIDIVPNYAAALAYHDTCRSLRVAPFVTACEILALLGARNKAYDGVFGPK